jgi:NhaP-type Na+/H+ or K+/H+ antiporter
MARAAYTVLCIAGMIGFALFVRWAMQSVSESAAIGYAAGFMSALVLYWLAQRIEQAQRDRA